MKPTYGKKYNNEIVQLWNAFKSQACVHCRKLRITCREAIEADHVRGEKKVHILSDVGWWHKHGGVEAWKKEREKCQPLCRFHHRIITHKRNKTTRRWATQEHREFVNLYKRILGECNMCGRKVTEKNVVGFDFDHIDRNTKKYNISNLCGKSKALFEQHIQTELLKCRLLCANCHLTKAPKQRSLKDIYKEAKKIRICPCCQQERHVRTEFNTLKYSHNRCRYCEKEWLQRQYEIEIRAITSGTD